MLRLRYHGTTTIPVEAECITPDNLAGKTPAEISALPVQHGNAPAPLGQFFSVVTAFPDLLYRRRTGFRRLPLPSTQERPRAAAARNGNANSTWAATA